MKEVFKATALCAGLCAASIVGFVGASAGLGALGGVIVEKTDEEKHPHLHRFGERLAELSA